MRVIKFRAWNVCPPKMYDLSESDYPLSLVTKGDTDYTKFMQYIGLKDSIGNEIYEGDIISVHNDDYHDTTFHEVIYNQEGHYPAFGLKGYYSESNSFSHVIASGEYSYSVIGNIYENPELLAEIK